MGKHVSLASDCPHFGGSYVSFSLAKPIPQQKRSGKWHSPEGAGGREGPRDSDVLSLVVRKIHQVEPEFWEERTFEFHYRWPVYVFFATGIPLPRKHQSQSFGEIGGRFGNQSVSLGEGANSLKS